MLPILTPEQMRALEQEAVAAGTSERDLMARAADEIAAYLDEHIFERPSHVAALVGPGNNGGDALAALARLVERDWEASALLVGRDDIGDVPAGAGALKAIRLLDSVDAFGDADVILDGIYGNGGRAELPSAAASAIDAAHDAARRSGAALVAVDCPSGVDSLTGEATDAAFRADVTLCISHPRAGLIREPAATCVGELVLLDIGLETLDAVDGPAMIAEAAVRRLIPRRDASAHKGSVGGLLIVGGAPGYYGAPRLSGEAALRAGSGYVGLAVPRSIITAIASQVPEFIFHPLSDGDGRRSAATVRTAVNDSRRYSALLVGPGLGRDEVARDLLEELFISPARADEDLNLSPAFGIPRRAKAVEDDAQGRLPELPWLIDADGLNWLARQDDWPDVIRNLRCVLTPHASEMARLLDIDVEDVVSDPMETASSAARDWGQVVILKHGYTCVATPAGNVYVAPRATPELATAGTGDVLSGLVGSFLAQGLAPEEAAIVAVYLGSMTGRHAAQVLGAHSVIARDLIEFLPMNLAELAGTRQRMWF